MAYIINKSNGTRLVVIEDGSINVSACDLTLVGKNYAGYGESIASNFVKLLENFSSPKQPLKPLTGQLWYDSSNKKLRVYNGSEFKSIPSLQSSKDYPTDQLKGDLHYNETEGKLYYHDGSRYILIGPQVSGKAALNTVAPALLEDENGSPNYVLKFQLQNFEETEINDVAIVSEVEIEPISEDYSVRFPVIKQGITLVGADRSTGVSVNYDNGLGYKFWGTAADSMRLGGRLSNEYVRYENPVFTSMIRVNSSDGINIDEGSIVLNDNQVFGAQITTKRSTLGFNVYDGITTVNVIEIKENEIAPERTGSRLINIGRTDNPFNNVYANTFVGNVEGTASYASEVEVNPTFSTNATFYVPFVNATSGNVQLGTDPGIVYNPANNIFTATNMSCAQIIKTGTNGIGNLGQTGNRFGTVFANSTTAVYADLAEKYLADAEYEPGTVLRLGGEKEVTICASYEHEGVAGIVSTAPAYLMNDGLENGVAIALKGRVPCKVKGPVKKGDILVSSSTPGHAEVRKYGHRTNPLAIIGKALQDFEGESGVIEVMVW